MIHTLCPEETGFLAAIRDSPDDDTARLVYADWLDERGRDEESTDQREVVALRAVRAAPGDDAPRAAFAALCESRGRPARAEFVRTELAVAALQRMFGAGMPMAADVMWEIGALRARARDLLGKPYEVFNRTPAGNVGRWFGMPGHAMVDVRLVAPGENLPLAWVCYYAPVGDRGWLGGVGRTLELGRGFGDALECAAGDWLASHAPFTAQHPLTRVRLLGVPRYDDTTGVAFLLPPRGHRHFRQCVRVEPWPDRNPGVSETELIMERRWPGITFDLRWQD